MAVKRLRLRTHIDAAWAMTLVVTYGRDFDDNVRVVITPKGIDTVWFGDHLSEFGKAELLVKCAKSDDIMGTVVEWVKQRHKEKEAML